MLRTGVGGEWNAATGTQRRGRRRWRRSPTIGERREKRERKKRDRKKKGSNGLKFGLTFLRETRLVVKNYGRENELKFKNYEGGYKHDNL
jgi:hypothetical protein